MQERLYPHIHNHEQLTKNTEILIRGLKALDIEILATEQYTKGLGFTIAPLKSLLNDITFIEKQAFSCCDEPRFFETLNFIGPRNVIIAGIETHVCVMQTVIDLIETGFKPIVVEDCVSSRKPNDKQIALQRMQQEGAIITTVESLLFELLRHSGTETFKEISKLIK
jgi:hypothetical protein